MSDKEYMECSVVAYPREIKFLHINGSAISYYVDRHISDYVDRLQKENQELKRKLNESIHKATEFESEVYELKKQLEEWEHHLKCSKEMLDIQGQKGNYDYDEYMLGLYNGMEYIIALFETREPNFINGKDVEFTNNKIQQKEFIKWLEDYINLFDKKDIYEEGSCDTIEEILNKYKEIIGVSDDNKTTL